MPGVVQDSDADLSLVSDGSTLVDVSFESNDSTLIDEGIFIPLILII
jgi:hypothetical protein